MLCALRSTCVPESILPTREDTLKDLDYFIPNAIARLGFVIDLAAKAVVSVWIEHCTTFAFEVGCVVDDGEAQLAL